MGFDTRIDTFMGEICAILKIRCQDQDQKDPGRTLLCPLGVFHAPAFAADKKPSRKIRYRKILREHLRCNERREKQAAAQQTFVFHKPLTNESPA